MKKKLTLIFILALFTFIIMPSVDVLAFNPDSIDSSNAGNPRDLSIVTSNGTLRINTTEPVELTGVGDNVKVVCTVENAQVTLIDVTLDSDDSPITFTGANNTLTLQGTNNLKAANNGCNAVSLGHNTHLTVYGPGTLNATGAMGDRPHGEAGGAGIGGGEAGTCYITIEGGIINATGGHSSAGIGIGGDITARETTSNVTINGGTITAYGGVYSVPGETVTYSQYGAGIGGGHYANVTITGGTIKKAVGGEYAAGIGNENIGIATVTISGGTIEYAFSPVDAAAIGGGCGCDAVITITGGEILSAVADSRAAAIGGGFRGGAEITIRGGKIVSAQGGTWAAAIGTGSNKPNYITPNPPPITCEFLMTGGQIVNAVGGAGGAGIGGGPDANADITVTGGTIDYVEGQQGGASIGGGNSATTVTNAEITITGGEIYAENCYSSAAIGAGDNGTCSVLNISGGTITAIGAPGSAAIGGSCGGDIGTINISGGEIYAQGGEWSDTDIGAGEDSTCDGVTISGEAAVFLYSNAISTVTTTTHTNATNEVITNGSAYGRDNFPASWEGQTGYGYLIPIAAVFDHNYGSPSQSDPATAYKGAYLQEPDNPTRTGYVFNGWHKDTAGEDPYYFYTVKMSSAVTLYADWIEKGTKFGEITGELKDDDGNPLANCSITLQSKPVTLTTDSNGVFTFGSAYYTDHTLIVRNTSGTEVARYSLTFVEGTTTGSSVDNTAKTITVTYTGDTSSVSVPFELDASGTSASVSGPVSFSHSSSDDDDSTVTNPHTGDDANYFVFIVMGVVLVIMAGVLLKKKVFVK